MNETLRFYFPIPVFEENMELTAGQELTHQMQSVLRLRPNDEVILINGLGKACIARILAFAGRAAQLRIEQMINLNTEPPVSVYLYQGMLKSAKFEWIIQKGTEIGVTAFIPTISEYSMKGLDEAGVAKKQRWRSIAIEAMEQSGRAILPVIEEPAQLRQALQNAASHCQAIFLAWEESGKQLRTTDISGDKSGLQAMAANVIQYTQVERPAIALFIGPEGGFSESEVQMAQSAGAKIIALGPRILRAETAAIAAAILIISACGGM